jgi:uncharacterized membrane protein
VRRTWFLIAHRLKTSLWLIPFACALAGILLSLVTVAVDRAIQGDVVPRSITGDPNAALIILSTVAASMVSLTALVLTITSVVVQLAMGQFSPRSVRPFLQDRPSQFAIGVFVGTFAHAMFAMREVRSFAQQGSVPGVSIVVSYVLVFVAVVVLVAYVHHIGNSLKVDSIIQSVGEETRAVLDRLYAEHTLFPDEPRAAIITADEAGIIFRVDHRALVEAAERADVTLTMLRRIGTFVPQGAPLVRWDADGRVPDAAAIRRAIAIGPERTMDQDGAFGVQTLVDITERSLTESFHDQTTAAQAIDRLHDIIRSLSGRSFPSGRFCDANDHLRLIVPELSWEDYVGLAFDQISIAAEDSPAVVQRVREALEDLLNVVPDDRREAVEVRLRNLRKEAAEEDADGPAVERPTPV